MQTIEFYERLSSIVNEARFRTILNGAESLLKPHQNMQDIRGNIVQELFSATAHLHSLSVDPANQAIISAFGIDQILSAKFLGDLITKINSHANTDSFNGDAGAHQMAFELKVLLLTTLRLVATVNTLLIEPQKKAVLQGEQSLAFEVMDVNNAGIGMERFKTVLESIQTLHDMISRIEEIPGRLAIAYLDSGSNSIISIKSDHRIIDSLGKLISDVWQRIRFGRYETFERKLESAEAGVRFIERLDEKEKAGLLDHETSAKLRHMVISETLGLFAKGTTLREIQTQTAIDNRTLLAEKIEVKQIAGGTMPALNAPRGDGGKGPDEKQ